MAKKGLSIKIDEEILEDLTAMSNYYNTTKLALVKKFLKEGLIKVKLDYVTDLYSKKEITIEKAAEITGVSVWEMMDHLKKRGISCQLSLNDIKEDARKTVEKLGLGHIAHRI